MSTNRSSRGQDRSELLRPNLPLKTNRRKKSGKEADNNASRPMTRSRVAELSDNRRITRSMTKAMREKEALQASKRR